MAFITGFFNQIRSVLNKVMQDFRLDKKRENKSCGGHSISWYSIFADFFLNVTPS